MKSKSSKFPAKDRSDAPKFAVRPSAPPERMSAILEELLVQAWCSLPDGTMEFRNRAWLDYAGVTVKDAGRHDWNKTVHPDDCDHCEKAWSEIRASGAAREVDARLRRLDGEYRWFRMRIVPFRDGLGRVTKWYGTNVDIDDHKRAEAMLSGENAALDILGPGSRPCALDAVCQLAEENDRLREEFRDLFDEAPIPYVHEGLDSRFIRANRAAMMLLGIDAADVQGTFGNTLVADTPENLRRLRDAFASVGLGNETRGVVLELRRKDNGQPIWVQWWSKPARSGAFTRTVLLDITEQVLIEQTKAALEFSLESGQVGDWDLDLTRDTSRRSLRHDRCFGYNKPIPEAEWRREVFIRHVHPEDREQVRAGLQQSIDGLLDWSAEFRVIWPDETMHWLAARGRVYRTINGRATRMLGIVVDITDRKRAEETLRATQAALEFALEAGQIGDWDLDLVHDTSRRSVRHDQCFGYSQPIPEAEWGFEVFLRHVHSDDRAYVDGSFHEAVGALRDWAAEFRIVWPDGSVHWLDARGRIYRTMEGKATRMLGIVMDISGRKKAEETIRASEQFALGQVVALKRALDALATEPDPDRLLGHILSTINEQFGAHSSSVWRRDEASGTIGFEFAFEEGALVSKFDVRFAGMNLRLPMENFWPWPDFFGEGKASLIEDIREVPAFALRDRLLPLGIVTVLLIPMSIVGRLEGAIGLRFTAKRQFRSEEIELAQALANQAMLAMRLTRLYAESRESAVIAERNRLARDIHDTLAQGFTGVIVQLEAAADATSKGLPKESQEHCARAAELARESLGEARRSVRALRPRILEDNDLCEALASLFRKMTASTGLQASFRCHGDALQLANGWDESFLRIAQESLTNTIHHADATQFQADLFFDNDEVRLDLKDNGRGFDVSAQHAGFGLLGIGERVEQMGGRLTIRSGAGDGTALSVQVPLPFERAIGGMPE
jgi:PAS domain S-box-containing protein